jgi:hypothetical protein
VGHMQRIFHVFAFLGSLAFTGTICVMIATALPNRGAMPDTPHWISDLLYDMGTPFRCLPNTIRFLISSK